MTTPIGKKIIAARKRGRSVTWMIQKIGCSIATVNYHLKKANLLNKRQSSTFDLVIELRRQGFTRENIALMIGVNPKNISKHIRRHKEEQNVLNHTNV